MVSIETPQIHFKKRHNKILKNPPPQIQNKKKRYIETSKLDLHREIWENEFKVLELAVYDLVEDLNHQTYLNLEKQEIERLPQELKDGWTQLPEYLSRKGVDEIDGLYALDMVNFKQDSNHHREQVKNLTKTLGSGRKIPIAETELCEVPNSSGEDMLAPYKIISLSKVDLDLVIDVSNLDGCSRKVERLIEYIEDISRYINVVLETEFDKTCLPSLLAADVRLRIKAVNSLKDKFGYFSRRDVLDSFSGLSKSVDKYVEEIAKSRGKITRQRFIDGFRYVDCGGLTKSTVSKAVNELKEAGLIVETVGGLELTDLGKLYSILVLGVVPRSCTGFYGLTCVLGQGRVVRRDRVGKPPPRGLCRRYFVCVDVWVADDSASSTPKATPSGVSPWLRTASVNTRRSTLRFDEAGAVDGFLRNPSFDDLPYTTFLQPTQPSTNNPLNSSPLNLSSSNPSSTSSKTLPRTCISPENHGFKQNQGGVCVETVGKVKRLGKHQISNTT